MQHRSIGVDRDVLGTLSPSASLDISPPNYPQQLLDIKVRFGIHGVPVLYLGFLLDCQIHDLEVSWINEVAAASTVGIWMDA